MKFSLIDLHALPLPFLSEAFYNTEDLMPVNLHNLSESILSFILFLHILYP